jgi:hypothetical protein
MSTNIHVTPAPGEKEGCLEIAEFERMNYFFGQLLSCGDFQLEQKYFREKLKLHNRCFHGYGTVCGLLVEPVPIPRECTSSEEEHERKLLEELKRCEELQQSGTANGRAGGAAPQDAAARIEELRRELGDFYRRHCAEEPHTFVRVTCGIAFDCHGNELILRQSRPVDLMQSLNPVDYSRVTQGARSLYVSLCYCEQPGDPARPVLPDVCGSAQACQSTHIRECARICVTVDPPKPDCRCETCCTPCCEPCLLLARIDCFHPGLPLFERHIHNHVRRHLPSAYEPTVITGVSWLNGHHYTQDEAKRLMGTYEHGEHHRHGLEVHFSRPVRASSIHPGVMDTWVIEGGRGRAGNIYNKSGEIVDRPRDGYVTRIVYRDTSREILQPGDRVLVLLRTEFLLDICCRPVNGMNVGGHVPVLEEYLEKFHLHPHIRECHIPPYGYGPWTSGIGAACGGFQGWFFIRENEREREHDRDRNREHDDDRERR